MYSEIVMMGILQAAVSHPTLRTVTAGRRDLEGLPFARFQCQVSRSGTEKNLPSC